MKLGDMFVGLILVLFIVFCFKTFSSIEAKNLQNNVKNYLSYQNNVR